jgi:hypothetical protein
MTPLVLRCASCGGPLPDEPGPRITCRFCRSVRAVHRDAAGRVDAITVAATEARAMARDVEARTAELQAEFNELIEGAVLGDSAAQARVLELQEGILRLTYAPTLHLLAAMDPADPEVVQAHADIDGVVRDVLAGLRGAFSASDG